MKKKLLGFVVTSITAMHIGFAPAIASSVTAEDTMSAEENTMQDVTNVSGIQYEITVTNLTKAQIFSPVAALIHEPSIRLFTLGEPAIAPLKELAEEGSTAGLSAAVNSTPICSVDTASGPTMPGQTSTVTVSINNPQCSLLTVASMLITTNDAFLSSTTRVVKRSRYRGGYRAVRNRTMTARAYDSGTEANTESCAHIPGPPCGNAGVEVTDGAEGYVYTHSGIHGIGDLAATTYDWNNPVAKITVRQVR